MGRTLLFFLGLVPVYTVLSWEVVSPCRPGLSAPRGEAVPALRLIGRRRFLGYFIFLVNLPVMAWNAYKVALDLSAGMQLSSPDLLNELVLLASSFCLSFVLPWWLPVFTSKYWFTGDGVKISRFFKGTVTMPYSAIARAEVYVKDERKGKASQEAMRYAKESASALRKSGFKFADYTNDDSTIVLLVGEKSVYLLSPKYPKAFVQKLRKRVGKLPAKMVELTPKGQRVRNF